MANGVAQLSEAEKVEGWLLSEFTRLGFDLATAERFAREGADVHRAETLIKAGCTLELAGKIVDRFVDGYVLMRP